MSRKRRIRVTRKPYRAHRKKKTWTVKRDGKTITMHAKKQQWDVEGSTYYAEDRGEPGRTPESEKWFEAEGEIAYRGKHWSKNLPERERHEIVEGVARRDGVTTAKRKLIALSNVTTDEETKRKARADYEYLKRKYG